MPEERRLAPVTAAFVAFGLFSGTLAVSTLDVERALHLGNGGFGLLLSLALLGAAAGNAAGGQAAERWGSGRVLAAGLVVWGLLLVCGGLAHRPVLLGAAVAAGLGAGGLVDVAMNVAASATLASAPGHLVRFHGRWNYGAAAGAGVTGALIHVGIGWRPVWMATGALAVVLAAVCWRASLPGAGTGEPVPLTGALSVIRRESLLLIAAAFAMSAMVEGGIDLWGVLYLRSRLSSGVLIGAGGAVLAYLVAGSARMLLGSRIGRRGPERGILIGAGTGAAGTAIMVASRAAIPAAAGLVLAAGGMSLCWPLFIARAAGGRERPGPGVGAVSAAGYLGLMAGPGLVGVLSRVASLRFVIAILALLAAVVAVVPTLGARRPEV